MTSQDGGSLLLARWVVALPGRWWASGAGRGGRRKWPWSDGVGWVVAGNCEILKKEAGSVIEMMMSVRVSPTPYLYGFFIDDVKILARARWSARTKNAELTKIEG